MSNGLLGLLRDKNYVDAKKELETMLAHKAQAVIAMRKDEIGQELSAPKQAE